MFGNLNLQSSWLTINMFGDFFLGQFAYHPLGMQESTVLLPQRGGGLLQWINGTFLGTLSVPKLPST